MYDTYPQYKGYLPMNIDDLDEKEEEEIETG
jgi:hypothetical protein